MKFIILGCGSSMGVPRADGDFGNCDPKNKKNYRTRCSALLKSANKNILIDTSPDLRQQLINNKINNIDYVLYSHMHADQTHGINDLRIFYIRNKRTIPAFADAATSKYLKKAFNYCFKSFSKEYPAIIQLNKTKNIMKIKDNQKTIKINSFPVSHGKVKSICYIFDQKLAYISDVSNIEKKYFRYFKKLKFLVIDCLWYRHHPSHLNLEKVLELVKIFKPKKTILTNLHSDLDYKVLFNQLPKKVIPAYDGLTLNL
ncbi:MBL fold metallo-hydrolase [Candidatus Pelagibacter sp.]|uniref:MBL fold metallo-hydrolase n=1 Tax=Candidatus Pelagibacter sp. TaxID=2024849 RepID=UPI003F87A11D